MKERIPQKTLQVSSKKADAILLSVAIIWGWGFIAGKIALETASPQWILFFRFSIAAICILAFFFKQIKNADKACVRWGILIGLLQFAALFTFYQTLASAVFAGIAAFCTGIPNELFSIHSWTGIVYLGVINTAVALGLQNFAQKYTSESHAALLLSLESVFGLLFSILYYGDILTLRMAIGCALIFAALLVSNRR